MTKEIIWIHDKALNNSLLTELNENKRALFIWDNKYFQSRSYTLKRLVFIYETLCQMPIEIIMGDTAETILSFSPEKIQVEFTVDTKIKKIIQQLSRNCVIEIIKPNPFVAISDANEYKRFFKYWNEAKKVAFFKNGMLECPKE